MTSLVPLLVLVASIRVGHGLYEALEADNHAYPFMASVQVKDGSTFKHLRTGVIIEANSILTSRIDVANVKVEDYRVLVGTNDFRNATPPGKVFEINKMYISNHNYTEGMVLIRLTTKIPFDHTTIDRVFVPRIKENFTRQSCVVVGWGSVRYTPEEELDPESNNVVIHPMLNRAIIPSFEVLELCRRVDKCNTHCAKRIEVPLAHTCGSAFGAPMVCRASEDEPWVVVGLLTSVEDCGLARSFDYYNSVESHLKWIIDPTSCQTRAKTCVTRSLDAKS